MTPPRLPKFIREELDGLEWSWEYGSKHWKIVIDGIMVAIWPRGHTRENNIRSALLVRSSIRRLKKGRHNEEKYRNGKTGTARRFEESHERKNQRRGSAAAGRAGT